MFTSATVSGGQLTLNWSGTGTFIVQQAATLTGSAGDWSDLATVNGNTYSVTVGVGNKFYRIKQ